MRVVLPLFLAVSLLGNACGKSSSNNSSSTPAAFSIVGTWRSACIDAGSGVKAVATLVNTDTDSTAEYKYYLNDPSCLTASSVDTVSRSYTLGGIVDGLTSTHKIDITTKSTMHSYQSAEAVSSANAASAYGYTDWAVGVSKDISGKKFSPTDEATDASGHITYQIVKVEDGKYSSGDTTTHDGSTDAKRPTSLDTNIFLTKQ